MKRVFRWGCLTLLVTLSGCNTVHSAKPLFGPEDAVAGRPLKPGLWLRRSLGGGDPDHCRFDPGKLVRKWPTCADWVLVRETDILSYDSNKTWSATAYVLAGGQPRVLQTTDVPGLTESQASAHKDEAETGYLGLAPTAHDPAGRISGFRYWSAQCGPPAPPKADTGSQPSTLAPLPGLTMDEGGQNCVAEDKQAVRRSVAASEAWSTDATEFYWVRDVRPGDFVN